MSLIMAKSLGNSKYRVFCQGCGVEVCVASTHELVDMSRRGVKVFCFDCDSVNADRIPEVLFCEDLEYWLNIGGQWFLVSWPNLARHHGQRVAYYRAITDELFERLALVTIAAAQSLSSSTKLHGNCLTDGVNGNKGEAGNAK